MPIHTSRMLGARASGVRSYPVRIRAAHAVPRPRLADRNFNRLFLSMTTISHLTSRIVKCVRPIAMQTTAASAARTSRRKRLSKEDPEEESPLLPTLSASVTFFGQTRTSLLATWGFALIWFSQVARLANSAQVVEVAAAVLSPPRPAIAARRLPDAAGLFLATGSMGLTAEATPTRRAVRPREQPAQSPADPGFAMAMGDLGILLADSDAAFALPAAPTKTKPAAGGGAPIAGGADPGLAMALGDLGLLLADSDAAFAPPRAARAQASRPRAAPSAAAIAASPDASGPSDTHFVLTCALVHTFIAFVGFALGNDTVAEAHWRMMLLRVTLGAFGFICVVLSLSWQYNVGPVPPVMKRLFASEASFVLVGAQSMATWLLCSMLLPHAGRFGRLCTGSRPLHGVITVLGVGLYALDMPVVGVLACFGTLLAAMPGAKLAATSSTVSAALNL